MDATIVQPNHYLDRKDYSKNRKYFFVSYSHKNMNIVYPLLQKIYDKQVNFWYDKGLNAGDIWDENVKTKMTDKNCVGVIVFLSDDFLKSKPCMEEIDFINQLEEQKKNFKIISININDFTPNNFIQNLSYLIAENSDDYIKALTVYRKFLNDKRIYVTAKDENDSLNDLFKNDCEALKEVLDLPNYIPPTIDIRIIPNIISENHDWFLYIPLANGKEKIKFKFILLTDQEPKRFIFVSVDCIDYVYKREIYSEETKYKDEILNNDNYSFISDIRIIDNEFIETYKDNIGYAYPTESADKKRAQNLRLMWVKDTNDPLSKNHIYTIYNTEIEKNFPIDNINFGIRLLLEINVNDVLEYNNEMEEK